MGQQQHPEFEHISKLCYVRRVLDESLRLQPTVPGYYRAAPEDPLLAGKYPMRKGERAVVMVGTLQRDPRWGPIPTSSTPTASPPSGSRPGPATSTNRSAPAKGHVSGGNSHCTRPC